MEIEIQEYIEMDSSNPTTITTTFKRIIYFLLITSFVIACVLAATINNKGKPYNVYKCADWLPLFNEMKY